jgi:hypothetical protein
MSDKSPRDEQAPGKWQAPPEWMADLVPGDEKAINRCLDWVRGLRDRCLRLAESLRPVRCRDNLPNAVWADNLQVARLEARRLAESLRDPSRQACLSKQVREIATPPLDQLASACDGLANIARLEALDETIGVWDAAVVAAATMLSRLGELLAMSAQRYPKPFTKEGPAHPAKPATPPEPPQQGPAVDEWMTHGEVLLLLDLKSASRVCDLLQQGKLRGNGVTGKGARVASASVAKLLLERNSKSLQERGRAVDDEDPEEKGPSTSDNPNRPTVTQKMKELEEKRKKEKNRKR